MKRILLAGAGVLAMASLANAADLPRQMYSKAPPPDGGALLQLDGLLHRHQRRRRLGQLDVGLDRRL